MLIMKLIPIQIITIIMIARSVKIISFLITTETFLPKTKKKSSHFLKLNFLPNRRLAFWPQRKCLEGPSCLRLQGVSLFISWAKERDNFTHVISMNDNDHKGKGNIIKHMILMIKLYIAYVIYDIT